MSQKIIVISSLFISAVLLFFAFSVDDQEVKTNPVDDEVVRVENGVQYIHVLAQGGYSPNFILAKAGMPTVLEIETKGTYDCSAALNIPRLGYQKFLSPTDVVDLEISGDDAVGDLQLVCSMGMYFSTISFK
ncbi:hypothetical protein COU74_04530 [Candidatus Peregrinibacteria bacterium CG10_big_fil_rev_8_21_14_0_10_36_19]|nr:MAG: hypothetical protein COU74_04530 [Candidatus Peregrinibacteria bacterium CG10_big_fil_rev_8_21_14_0_10_36_19]